MSIVTQKYETFFVNAHQNEVGTVLLRIRASRSGASYPKLTTSLVNVSLRFKTLTLQIHCYFLLEKCENHLHCKRFSHFYNKNNSGFDNVVGIYLTS